MAVGVVCLNNSMKQYDLICNSCPLTDCDEESLWCVFRFMTNPNDAQKAVLETIAINESKLRRKQFDAGQYTKNREKKIAAALERYHGKRNSPSNDSDLAFHDCEKGGR